MIHFPKVNKFFRGLVFGVLLSLPLWIVIVLIAWIVTR